MLGHRVGHLEAHRRAEAAPRELPLHGLEQVLVAVFLDLEIGVAGDPEQVPVDHLHTGEHLTEMGPDQLLQRQEGRERRTATVLIAVYPHQPWHVVGHLYPGEALDAAVRVAHHHGQVQRQARDVRKRVRRVHRQRGEHREDLFGEVSRQPQSLLIIEIGPGDKGDVVLVQLGAHRVEADPGLASGELPAAHCDLGQLILRGQAVRAAHRQPRFLPALEPGDAHHVELVLVRREDRQELGPLQQRLAGVLGERQYPGVEVEPGQFAVEVAVVG